MSIYKVIHEKLGQIGEIVADDDLHARQKIRSLYGSKQKIKAVRLENSESTELPGFMRY